ncbi:helix-turn-helix transcriptional regulator [Kitasatospora sp. NRRL B-11411]|uniref:helix-turn-helix domain-containing protein n=1 Tax=Kitasatospora sp. NRRL B-11411 TaxID=1463822 RepID=UPI0004C336A1|nr:helix-turn-helix transcriptional regulator [Kitasatospora sp. NRRL B-11411]
MAWPEREVDPSKSARHFYGAEIRRLRTERGWSLARLAEEVHFSPSTMSRVENGDIRVPDSLSEKLDSVLMTDGFFARMFPLARQESHPAKYQEFLSLADSARVYESYSPGIHGLLQTEACARRILRSGIPYGPDEEVEQRVQARLERQIRMYNSAECRYWFILDEAAIRRQIGTPAEMTEQLTAILTAAQLSNVVVQVLPFSAGVHSETSSMSILRLEDNRQVAYEESTRAGVFFEEERDVAERRALYDLLRAQALSKAESERLIRAAMEGLIPDGS